MSEFDERISKAYDLIERYGRSESDIHYETGLDADDCFRDLMVYVKGLVARIAELEAAQRWIPVSERLPEPYTRVLACIKSGYMEVDYMYSEPIVDVGIADFNSLDNVTHWMPLPPSPESEVK